MGVMCDFAVLQRRPHHEGPSRKLRGPQRPVGGRGRTLADAELGVLSRILRLHGVGGRVSCSTLLRGFYVARLAETLQIDEH